MQNVDHEARVTALAEQLKHEWPGQRGLRDSARIGYPLRQPKFGVRVNVFQCHDHMCCGGEWTKRSIRVMTFRIQVFSALSSWWHHTMFLELRSSSYNTDLAHLFADVPVLRSFERARGFARDELQSVRGCDQSIVECFWYDRLFSLLQAHASIIFLKHPFVIQVSAIEISVQSSTGRAVEIGSTWWKNLVVSLSLAPVEKQQGMTISKDCEEQRSGLCNRLYCYRRWDVNESGDLPAAKIPTCWGPNTVFHVHHFPRDIQPASDDWHNIPRSGRTWNHRAIISIILSYF